MLQCYGIVIWLFRLFSSQMAGVMNAWICNEVKGGAGYADWGSDVDLNAYGSGLSSCLNSITLYASTMIYL